MPRLLLLAGVGLVAFLLGLVARLPADRAVAWFAPENVELQGVRGTAWSGRAAHLDYGGPVPVTALDWDLAAWRLVTGTTVADVELEWAGLTGRGTLARGLGGDLRVRDALVRGPVAGVARAFGGLGLQLEGDLLGRIEDAALVDGRIERLAGRAEWSDAAITAPLALELGRVRVAVEAAEGRPGQRVTISSAGGALAIDGTVDLRPDGRYRADLRLRPAADAPGGLRDTLGMIARRDGDAFRLRRSGRLPAPGGGR